MRSALMGTLGAVDPQGRGGARRLPVIQPSSLLRGLAYRAASGLVIRLGEPAAITLGGPAAITLAGLGCDHLARAMTKAISVDKMFICGGRGRVGERAAGIRAHQRLAQLGPLAAWAAIGHDKGSMGCATRRA